MANSTAIRAVEAIYQHVDDHVRELLPPLPGAEVDTINVIVGDGATVPSAGVSAALKVDFEARITGAFLQEFDGTSGSISIGVARSQPGSSPSWTNMVGPTPFAISSSRFYANETVADWAHVDVQRGDVLRFSVVSASTIMRVLVALRIRRLEP